jgi:hypothetical protein
VTQARAANDSNFGSDTGPLEQKVGDIGDSFVCVAANGKFLRVYEIIWRRNLIRAIRKASVWGLDM